ncbi:hypothetical protein [Streptomyces sp. NPDC014894]
MPRPTRVRRRPDDHLRQSGYWRGRPCDELLMDAIADDHVPTTGAA